MRLIASTSLASAARYGWSELAAPGGAGGLAGAPRSGYSCTLSRAGEEPAGGVSCGRFSAPSSGGESACERSADNAGDVGESEPSASPERELELLLRRARRRRR